MAAWKSLFPLEFAALFLALGFFCTLAPFSLGADPAPAKLIQKFLPSKKTIRSASKPEVLSAVCSAVRKNRKSGAPIASAAVTARSEFAGDIVAGVLRCAGKTDCDYVGSVVAAAFSARASAATSISDAAMARAPNCEENIQKAATASGNTESDAVATKDEPPATGTSAGTNEGFDPHEQLVPVCENGAQRAVRASQVDDFLRTHPASVSGRCPPTRGPSPSPVKAPTAPAKPGGSASR